jgi:excisionase family DNA binding protein
MDTPMPDRMLREGLAKVAEAAEFLRLSRSKLYLLMDGRELPYVKIGRSRRIPWRALFAFVERHTIARSEEEAREGT